MTPKKQAKLLSVFSEIYKDPQSELRFKNRYQLLICVMLSAQSTDKKVNEITPKLFRKFPSFKKLSSAKLGDIEQSIRQVNYYKTKAKHLKETAEQITTIHGSRVPTNYDDLVKLPGVGNKTANVILCELGAAFALPVDTHVFRLAHRLGLSKGKTPERVEEDLKKAFDKSLWRNLHHWLIFHGRRVCKAQKPLCQECQIASLCPSKSSNTSTKDK